jgi:hypothetical protein
LARRTGSDMPGHFLRSQAILGSLSCLTLFWTALAALSNPCNEIASLLPGKVVYPNSTAYENSVSSYFFLEERLNPICILQPTSSLDVSTIVKELASFEPPVQFAIRSGGHSPVSGAANIANGITIDLSLMNSINLSSDKRIVSVGGGAEWSHIYSKLVNYNLSVVGGRDTGVGVGGFLTGGMSHFRIYQQRLITVCRWIVVLWAKGRIWM